MIYQLRVRLMGISPMIWRRLLVHGDSTITDLHYTLQLSFGWMDYHLNRLVIRGKDYGVYHEGGMNFSDDPDQVRLADFHFRVHERFLYEYNFTDLWQHEIRVEAMLPVDPRKRYPLCTGGARAVPPEECGGPWAYMELRQPYTAWRILDRLSGLLADGDPEDIEEDIRYVLNELRGWLRVDQFNRREANRRLAAYSTGDEEWLELLEEPL